MCSRCTQKRQGLHFLSSYKKLPIKHFIHTSFSKVSGSNDEIKRGTMRSTKSENVEPLRVAV